MAKLQRLPNGKLLTVGSMLAVECCCESVVRHECGSCNLPIRDVAVLTLSGFANGSCSPCSMFNGEHLVPQFGLCSWRKSGTIECGEVTRNWTISGGIGGSGGNIVVQFALTIFSGLGNDLWSWSKILGPTGFNYDCAGEHTLLGSGAPSGSFCTHDGSNAGVEI